MAAALARAARKSVSVASVVPVLATGVRRKGRSRSPGRLRRSFAASPQPLLRQLDVLISRWRGLLGRL
jgi:hypothetical protein